MLIIIFSPNFFFHLIAFICTLSFSRFLSHFYDYANLFFLLPMQSHQLQSSMVGNAVPIKSVELSTFINNCHEFKHFIAQYIAPHWRQLALIAGCIPPSPAPRETDLDCAYWLLSMFFRWKLTLGSFVDAINQIPELFTFTRHLGTKFIFFLCFLFFFSHTSPLYHTFFS